MHHELNKTTMISKVARIAIISLSLFSTMAMSQILHPALVESLKDSDQDGVIDIRDVCANTPQGTDVDNHGCSLTELEYFRFNFDVQFDTGSYRLKTEYHSRLNDLASFLQSHPETLIFIEGHTDNVGDKRFNLALSHKRAQSIADALVSIFHISPSRIRTFGYGQERPLVSNITEADKLLNRRVSGEIVYPLDDQDTNNNLVIRFKLNRYGMTDTSLSSLQSLGQLLQENTDALALIEGYTDNIGNQSYNVTLSMERAKKVADILHFEYAIPQERLKTLGHGEANPIASNDTFEGREQNRRVTIKVVKPFKATKEVLLPKWTIWSVDQMDKEKSQR